MSRLGEADLIYNWNLRGRRGNLAPQVTFLDETLRDGIQGPSISDPSIEAKLRILELEEELGIDSIDLGLQSVATCGCSHCLSRPLIESGPVHIHIV